MGFPIQRGELIPGPSPEPTGVVELLIRIVPFFPHDMHKGMLDAKRPGISSFLQPAQSSSG